jgi:predicted O-methyltransferase YrrM
MDNWAMTITGTASYDGAVGLPKEVARAVELAHRLHFENSCRLEQGRLLQVVAAGHRGGVIGETGTGCGVGLSWMLSGAGNDARIFSVDIDSERAHACQELFKSYPNVRVESSDWTALLRHGPFDLLVLDGGGSGKTGEPVAADEVLRFGGTLTIDDFTPFAEWPPIHEGRRDEARLFWLNHGNLRATEIRLSEDLSTIVATRIR